MSKQKHIEKAETAIKEITDGCKHLTDASDAIMRDHNARRLIRVMITHMMSSVEWIVKTLKEEADGGDE